MAEKLTFSQRVLNAQKELKSPKTNYNSFSKFYYRSAEDILEAVKPVNAKHGILLTITDDIVQVGERYYIKASATLKSIDSDEFTTVTAFARESLNKKGQDESQITGTASSYARKYALNGLYLIDDTKDADTNEYKQVQDNAPKATNKRMDLLNKVVEEVANLYELDIAVMKEKMNIYDGMTDDEVGTALNRLNEAKNKREGK